MRILIDECAPRALKQHLVSHGHECFTVQEAGWSGKQNGELLSLAENVFDVFVTLDTNLRYQQNLNGTPNRYCGAAGAIQSTGYFRPLFSPCVSVLEQIKAGEVVLVSGPT